MKTTFKNFLINSTFKGDKVAPWSDKQQNYNNHTITVTNTETEQKISFEFWGSIMEPEVKTEDELLHAFYCFISDAVSGNYSFNEFCGEFGYDEDSRKAEKTWKACKKSLEKLNKIYNGDVYDLANELQEIAG
mgnify:CR=1 FL=1